MPIEKKLKIRRVGCLASYRGYVREVPEDGSNQPAGQWKEATEWIDKDMIRYAAPESEVRKHCIEQTNLFILRNDYIIIEEEETFE